jgi:hypothetical protein
MGSIVVVVAAGVAFLIIFFAILVGLVLLPLIIHIWAIIDISQTPDPMFGPPWDNTKQAWLIGLAVAFMIPGGHIVAPIIWWTQVRGPKQRGEALGRPFWANAPRPPPPGLGMPANYPMGGYGPGVPAQPPYAPGQYPPGQYPPGPPAA